MNQNQDWERTYSRRQFLRWASISVAGALTLSAMVGRPMLSRVKRSRQAQVLPEGSIFTPAEGSRDRG